MALVCDIESSESKIDTADCTNEDLEDGEIEDDDEEMPAVPAPNPPQQPPQQPPPTTIITPQKQPQPPQPPLVTASEKNFHPQPQENKFERPIKHEQRPPRPKHEDKKKGHMTEAERSVMFLHKLERMEREKRDKYRREPDILAVDDFASNIEKAIANVLKKERPSDEEKEDDKRCRKRKKKERDRKKKMRKIAEFSPKSEDADENDMLNVRCGSPPDHRQFKDNSPRTEDTISDDTDYSSDKSGDERRERRREKRDRKMRNRDRMREMRNNRNEQNINKNKGNEPQPKDSGQLCVYYLQGKCQKGDDCQYSHNSQPPTKWELCKFYLNDCCAKGDKCLYMHSDFPCKFYHTGQQCLEGENCKFAHGRPLSDRLKQILFKHIETAPKDILGRFPRMNREEAAYKINQTQRQLEGKYGVDKEGKDSMIPSIFDLTVPPPGHPAHEDKKGIFDKPMRNRPSRWQEPDMSENPLGDRPMQTFKPFQPNQDQDMRLGGLPISINGDVDMRALPPPIPTIPPPGGNFFPNDNIDLQYPNQSSTMTDVDVRSIRGDVDIRNHNNIESMTGRDVDIRKRDIDTRQPPSLDLFDRRDIDTRSTKYQMEEEEGNLEIVLNEDDKDKFDGTKDNIPSNLPKRQRELYMRIQAQQKENLFDERKESRSDSEQSNIDWYSDDSNEGRLTIKCDEDNFKDKEDTTTDLNNPEMTALPNLNVPPPIIKPQEMVEKLGDLSKINISEEVTRLLSSMRQSSAPMTSPKETKPRDPRQQVTTASEDTAKAVRLDPRRARQSSTEDSGKKPEKISIYEQGCIDTESGGKDVDLRSIDKDLDLRQDFNFRGTTSNSITGRPDVDLRQLTLPFKAMQNYTPATEIDASCNSHLPITWSVRIIDIPKPDYTGLKLSKQEAQTTGDPRLRKIFRLDLEEKDSPASPKQQQSPKAQPAVRVDPRIRKADDSKENPMLSYAQQMNVLQGSSFYQNLTSNQKVLLNQELSNREQASMSSGGGGGNEQVLTGILNALGLMQQGQQGVLNSNVLSLLSTIGNQMGLINTTQAQNAPLLGPAPNMVNHNLLGNPQNNDMVMKQMAGLQPGLLGAAPPDFPLNFDPRNGTGGGTGLLGNAPPPFLNFQGPPPQQQQANMQQQQQQDNQNFNFTDDFFPDNGGGGGGGNFNNRDGGGGGRPFRENRGGGRRGRNNYNHRNNRSNFRNRNNRSNRGAD